jgi:hypothetical protein
MLSQLASFALYLVQEVCAVQLESRSFTVTKLVLHRNAVYGGVVGRDDSGGDPATDCSKHSESGGV